MRKEEVNNITIIYREMGGAKMNTCPPTHWVDETFLNFRKQVNMKISTNHPHAMDFKLPSTNLT